VTWEYLGEMVFSKCTMGPFLCIEVKYIDHLNLYYEWLFKYFFYRPKDVGRPKAEVAAEFLNDRVPNCSVVPYPFDRKTA
jgi:molybdopterin/thiamine biosynthesis adenylyltransferase